MGDYLKIKLQIEKRMAHEIELALVWASGDKVL